MANVEQQFQVLSTEELMNVEGGIGLSATLLFLGGIAVEKAYDYAASSATASCQRNPRQWFCVNFP